MAVKQYPEVAGEIETLQLIRKGHSIARFGDGEFNHVRGRKNVSQVYDPKLTAELQAILVDTPKNCLVGIPTMSPEGPKYKNWSVYKDSYANYLNPKKRYYSAFITRPDSAPWINEKEYFDDLETLWLGHNVTLVGNGRKSLKKEFLEATGAACVNWIECRYRDAYQDIDELEHKCVEADIERVLLCVGPTATCLAVRLARRKMHAIDLGHVGSYWRMYANPKKGKK